MTTPPATWHVSRRKHDVPRIFGVMPVPFGVIKILHKSNPSIHKAATPKWGVVGAYGESIKSQANRD